MAFVLDGVIYNKFSLINYEDKYNEYEDREDEKYDEY